MGEERAQHGRGVRENVGDVVPSAAVRVAGAGVMMRDQGDKEIRFACSLAVVRCDRSEVAKLEMSVDMPERGQT